MNWLDNGVTRFLGKVSRFYDFKYFVDRMFHPDYYDWGIDDSNVFGYAETGKK